METAFLRILDFSRRLRVEHSDSITSATNENGVESSEAVFKDKLPLGDSAGQETRGAEGSKSVASSDGPNELGKLLLCSDCVGDLGSCSVMQDSANSVLMEGESPTALVCLASELW